MTEAGWLPAPVGELFGPDATAEESYDLLTVDVPPTAWITALRTARDTLACTYFDWLSAVDEPGTGFRVSAHVVALSPVRRLLVRTTVPHEAPVLPTAVDVYAGAGWHERETHEMFGVGFEGHPALDHLLLPETFEGHPLRKDFVLAARVAKAWPGAKEPGESEHGGPKRRQMLPPGVPDPNEWGPLRGQLPAAPARPARGARAAGDRPARTPADRPPRRTRTASQGSASQTPGATAPGATAPEATTAAPDAKATPEVTTAPDATAAPAGPTEPQPTEGTEGTAPARPPRRARSAGEGSASQRPDAGGQTPAGPRRTRTASGGSASQRTEPGVTEDANPAPRGSDAPWHHARPAFEDPTPEPPAEPTPEPPAEPRPRQAAPGPENPAPGPEDPTSDPENPTSDPEDPAPGPDDDHPTPGGTQ
jgi:NADH:ubiquinone oxidoreductase subunit C